MIQLAGRVEFCPEPIAHLDSPMSNGVGRCWWEESGTPGLIHGVDRLPLVGPLVLWSASGDLTYLAPTGQQCNQPLYAGSRV